MKKRKTRKNKYEKYLEYRINYYLEIFDKCGLGRELNPEARAYNTLAYCYKDALARYREYEKRN